MGQRGHLVDQCYGALRRRPAAFLHVRRVMFVAARLESQSRIHARTIYRSIPLGYREHNDQGEYHSAVGVHLAATNGYAMHTQGKSGCQQYLGMDVLSRTAPWWILRKGG